MASPVADIGQSHQQHHPDSAADSAFREAQTWIEVSPNPGPFGRRCVCVCVALVTCSAFSFKNGTLIFFIFFLLLRHLLQGDYKNTAAIFDRKIPIIFTHKVPVVADKVA